MNLTTANPELAATIPSAAPTPDERSIVVTRLLNAPRDLVFKVWTQPEHIPKWWGPQGFTNTISEMDVREGGTWRYVMHSPDGTDYPNKIVYEEVVSPELLVYSHTSEGEDGIRFRARVTFDDQNGQTLLTMSLLFDTIEERAHVIEFRGVEGLNSTIDCLEEYLAETAPEKKRALKITLPSDREFTLTREFAAPRPLVFEAWTKPEHVMLWWGCDESTITVCEIDLRIGGSWRYVLRVGDNPEFGFHGVYREIEPFHRLVHTSVFEMMPEHEALVTVTFDEHDSVTTVTETTLHASREARDGHLQSGMEEGSAQSYNRLENLLENLV